ncbi:hypothetical protein YPPY64_4794, partial [Yersinia pestis PY-64]
MFPASPAC